MTERWTGTDRQLTQRPKSGWTRWEDGGGQADIERVWHEARVLHFPKLNCSAWFDGSDHVGIALWGIHGDLWTMKKPPAGWKPSPHAVERAAEALRAIMERRAAERAARGEEPL